MSTFLLLLVLVSEGPGPEVSDASEYVFGTGAQWSLLSSFLPCLSIRYWGDKNFGIQGMVTALMTEEDEGMFYVGLRGMSRVIRRLRGGGKVSPYLGLGVGYRQDKYRGKEDKRGLGMELFSGIEWYPYDFVSFNIDFGVRYAPASLAGVPWRIGIGGGGIIYFF